MAAAQEGFPVFNESKILHLLDKGFIPVDNMKVDGRPVVYFPLTASAVARRYDRMRDTYRVMQYESADLPPASELTRVVPAKEKV
jgi:hypothetical protein